MSKYYTTISVDHLEDRLRLATSNYFPDYTTSVDSIQ